MAGAGLTRLLSLAVTDVGSLGRVRRALDAWGRKGLLEAGYLKMGYDRINAFARDWESAAAAAAAAVGGRNKRKVSARG
jgi:hypothetical protein